MWVGTDVQIIDFNDDIALDWTSLLLTVSKMIIMTRAFLISLIFPNSPKAPLLLKHLALSYFNR